MSAVITRSFVVSNWIECALWLAIAIACAGFWLKHRHRDQLIAAVAFALFAVSDAIETRTGAWWRPWPLLALKALCVLTFVVLLYRYRQRTRSRHAGAERSAAADRDHS